MMGSGAETARATIDALGPAAKLGVLTVKLFRPWSVADFVAALPATVRRIAVLDRTKEPGAIGEPLYQDVVTALAEARIRRHGAVRGDADGHRRPLRSRLEGVLAGDGEGRLRRARRARARDSTSRSASWTT